MNEIRFRDANELGFAHDRLPEHNDKLEGDLWGLGLFLKQSFLHPLRTAAQAPSSKALAREMVRAALDGQAHLSGPIIELGPGTGAITNEILAYGVPAKDIIMVEQNPDFCDYLRHKYPGVTIIKDDVFAALNTLQRVGAKAVISGLPLVQLAPARRLTLVHRYLGHQCLPRARFTQFTYGWESPLKTPAVTRVKTTISPRIWFNIWPALVCAYALK